MNWIKIPENKYTYVSSVYETILTIYGLDAQRSLLPDVSVKRIPRWDSDLCSCTFPSRHSKCTAAQNVS